MVIDSYMYKQFVKYLCSGMILSKKKIMTTDKENNMNVSKNNYADENPDNKRTHTM